MPARAVVAPDASAPTTIAAVTRFFLPTNNRAMIHHSFVLLGIIGYDKIYYISES
ncbi:hypothetical protein D3C84_971950 [compost metagenome]